MILNDLAEVLYAPQRVFKKIIANPKYLGVIIVILLFLGLQIGMEYNQFAHTYSEQNYPVIFFSNFALVNQLPTFINATNWVSSSDVSLTNNGDDFYNYSIYLAGFGAPTNRPEGYYNIFENTSLQISAPNTNNIMAALTNTSNLNCATNGFRNLTITLKMVEPLSAPQNVTVTLYSLADENFYTYDITGIASSNLGSWNTLTIPVGPQANGWSENGNPTWENITSLMLNFNYPASQNTTIRIGALYFGGLYYTPVQYGTIGIVIEFLQVFSLQILFTWLVLSALIYIFLRVVKNPVLWKPLFIAIGFAMFILVIRALINFAFSFTLSNAYYPFDIAQGTRFDSFATLYYPTEAVSALSASSQAMIPLITSATAIFRTVVAGMVVVSYAWLALVTFFVIGAVKPELAMPKRSAFSILSVALTVLLLWIIFGVI